MIRKILIVSSILVGAMFVNSGLNKFFNYLPVPEDLPQEMVEMSGHLAAIGWLMPVVAAVEIMGGLFFAIPRTRPLGTLMLIPILVGIVLVHVAVAPATLAIPLVLFALVLWALFVDIERFTPLINPINKT